MRIINVIEVIENSIISTNSFPIEEDQLSQEKVEAAEELFSKCAIENGADEDDVDSYIEDGYYVNGDYSVSLTWSDIN